MSNLEMNSREDQVVYLVGIDYDDSSYVFLGSLSFSCFPCQQLDH